MRRRLLLTGLLACTFAGCREAVAPWEPDEILDDTVGAVRLTWSAGGDRYPQWLPDGDTLLYAGDGFPGLPAASGLLLRIPRAGGIARLAIPALQATASGGSLRFAQPALSPDGERIAFLELVAVRTAATVLNSSDCRVPEPRLDSAVLHVRAPVEHGAFRANLAIAFPGLDSRQKATLPGPFSVRLLPLQLEFAASGEVLARPAWSPDGSRLVYSDGVRLLVWTPGAGAPVPVPATEDGLSPAWSRDGNWIAFARWSRGDSTRTPCDIAFGRSVERQDRWTYSLTGPRLFLVRPDGSGLLELGSGRDPTWGADGSLFFRDGGRVRVRSADGTVRDVPDTEAGGWPAVSRQGTHLAFVRVDSLTGSDLWVVRLSR
jgi:hypothetical protein